MRCLSAGNSEQMAGQGAAGGSAPGSFSLLLPIAVRVMGATLERTLSQARAPHG